MFDWTGTGDKKKAIELIKPALNTQRSRQGAKFTSDFEEVFDELYHRVHTSQPLEQSFIEKMNETHNKIIEIIQETTPGFLRMRERLDALDPPDAADSPDSQHGESKEGTRQETAQKTGRKAPQRRTRRASSRARAGGRQGRPRPQRNSTIAAHPASPDLSPGTAGLRL